ncbi:FAD/FMN-containing dehydrogenase [Colletotrichum orchidophilum]|uniref:FAD/FMN-containing dehydrogenase n=1 Tax=Colletotrichum orchidophilum TaxID=1209926 RepID=A0A1G4B0V8_9PEZI|nr:FAD/FMN-containing dehydrogenase [Colletotrichum orchidophilum]OHE94942.1 FAD/FMN-containing dehydrogenase [Colletotrichum orchidophilum]
MAALEASPEFRGSHPTASTLEQISLDAPLLHNLVTNFPNLLVYTISAEKYENVRTFFNANMTQLPLAIVRPRTDAEVVAIVQELKAQDIPFGLRSGGHDLIFGQAQGKDGVIVDLRGLDSIFIAEDRQSVRVGGGIMGIKLSRFLQQHKLLTPHGLCPTVSIAGWAMGGGYGYMNAYHGLGADQILGARVVLANGSIVDTKDHPDLLWALCGAGNGNFGVIGEVLKKFGEFEKDLPINFTGEATHMALPGVGPVFAWLFAWTSANDDLEEGWAFFETMKALGTPVLNTVAEGMHTKLSLFKRQELARPAVDDFTFFNAMPSPTNVRWYPRLRMFECFTPGIASAFGNNSPPGATSATVIHAAHGRAIEANPAACYPLRKRHRIATPLGAVIDTTSQAVEYEEYKKWADDLVDALSEQGGKLPYGNRNLGPEKDMDWVATYGEETLSRLREIKKKFDPQNVFKTGYLRLNVHVS